MRITDTIDWIDVTWTAVSVAGLLLWLWNLRRAAMSLRAVRRLGVVNGRRVWARFGVMLTCTMVAVEVVFVAVGVNAMTRVPPVQSQAQVTRLLAVVSFLVVTVLLTLLAYRWADVDRTIVRMARSTPADE